MSLRIVHCEIKVIPYGTCKNRYIVVRHMQLDANKVRTFSNAIMFNICTIFKQILSYFYDNVLTLNLKLLLIIIYLGLGFRISMYIDK